jgi:hypothetical protein
MDSLDPEIRRVVLDGMRQALPDARTEARVLSGLLARIGDAGGPGDGGNPVDPGPALGSTAGIGATLKAIVGTVVVGAALVGGVAVATRDAPEPAAKPAPSAMAPEHAPAPVVAPPIEPAIAEAKPAPAPATTPPTIDVAPARPKPAAAPSGAPPDDLAAETEIIAQAEAALAAGETERALALASTHAQRYPAGQLAIEGEAIRIAAACVAKREDANATAEQFLRRHPRSPASAKVRARCGAIAEIDEGQ